MKIKQTKRVKQLEMENDRPKKFPISLDSAILKEAVCIFYLHGTELTNHTVSLKILGTGTSP
jgi:hypothetical protein